MKTPPVLLNKLPGFSLVELVLTITLLGILASVFVMKTGSQSTGVIEIKLEADVRQLNQMASLYKADGGSLSNLTTVGDVLSRLKNYRSESALASHTGAASGRLLDARIEPVMGSGQAGRKRAVWNPSKQRFEVVATGGAGAFSFEINPARSTAAGQVDKRGEPALKYDGASKPGWIWGSPAKETPSTYRDPSDMGGAGRTVMFNPNEMKPGEPPDDGGTGGPPPGDGGGGGEDDPEPPPPAVKLPTPNASPSGGTHSFSGFPSAVTLSPNGAPAGDSILQYRLNGGAWQTDSGGAISISPGDVLEAQNIPAPGVTTYTTGDVAINEYYRLVAGFSGAVDPGFVNAQGGGGLVSSVESPAAGVTVFTHGNTQTDLGNGEIFETGEPNVLTFKAGNFNSIQPNTWFTAGSITMLNGEIYNNSDANAVTLKLDFNLSDPPSQSGTAEIRLDLVNTPNSADRMTSADIVRLANPVTDFTMTIDGVTYRLEVRWQSTDPSAGVVQGSEFLIFEGATASGRLQARFVSL